jgi:DNA polymerase
MGFKIVMHVHDEIVIEDLNAVESILDQLLSQPISWAPGLPLGAESFTTKYYQK